MKRTFIISALGILALIFNSCICKNTYCKIETAPPTKHLISKDTAEDIQKNFFSNQEQVRLGAPKAIANERSDFWFPAKELSGYLCLTQKTAKNKGYEISGYRMYLGAENNSDGTIGKYKLFIVPTIRESTNNTDVDTKMKKTINPSDKADYESSKSVDDPNTEYLFDISGSGNPRFEFHSN
ncbi:hypothetical protein [Chryseobacterium limigenitum]|uniref:Lipoprotein n=1 Tax=Chryseobacterium limigenitum TaxID=1612149 RepID=A0A1K2IXK1_9FLAO|nr:hypothetical protein [Chryseobacterium limigenitum]SFZ97079.1 hypothetical protein SAMN05216324_13810 [Chryseobacterium limigenitum]